MRQFVMRLLLMYLLYQYYVKPKQQTPPTEKTSLSPQQLHEMVEPGAAPLMALFGAPTVPVPRYFEVSLQQAWPLGTVFQFRVFVSLRDRMTFEEAAALPAEHAVWHADRLDLTTKQHNYMAKNVTLHVPHSVNSQNSTWYAHVFVTKGALFDMPVDELTDAFVRKNVLYCRHELVQWRKVDLSKEGKNLLAHNNDAQHEAQQQQNIERESESESESESEKNEASQVRYDQVWKPQMPIVIVTSPGALRLSELPPKAGLMFNVDTESREYYPPLDVNEFWLLSHMLRPMNQSVQQVTIEATFSPISLTKWCIYKQFETMWDKQIAMGAMREEERDNSKQIFTDTNPVLLGTTIVVSLAHSVLEMLAFKNDISHWKNIKSMEGVSVRSMLWKIVMEAIIFLYLWDNETSWMITIGNGVGVAIAIWKLGKAVKFERSGQRKLFGIVPWFEMTDRESYSKKTKEYDEEAMKYLSYLMYPLVIGYAVYSLVYEKHKSWYSWVISSLVGAVYAFGFIMMFPQIFINYKLKSVAHMPMKAMMYKTLNTVIDDLFSFIIKMPWMHRVACFRDDVVFLIVLYQRWIYPVDKKRVNEFGQQFDEDGTGETGETGETESVGESKGAEEKKKD
ncbi:unnamed protein product [Agarophyton chilense]